MFQYIGGQSTYDLFETVSIIMTAILCLFFIKEKTTKLGLFSKHIVFFVSKRFSRAGKALKYFLAFVEWFALTVITVVIGLNNITFGDMVGTGANYFGTLFSFIILGFVFSVVIASNPMEQMDLATCLLPFRLIFLKIACFGQGCCWGIPWKYGLYNYHDDHPGNQVPVQAIEALLALAIFIFLLIYRKKAKTGTVFPMYIILYSATRFPVEFLSAAHEKIAGPFNTYHFLCIAGVAIGFIMLIIVNFFGDKMTAFFEKPHRKLNEKIAKYEEEKSIKFAKKTKR
ncbi:MAG: prolipoprotein diacylglyceryl transferase [Clostridia bacterium]|nr:prolipoprotein diacylglyceryl transferase [Clostridia bacterium]